MKELSLKYGCNPNQSDASVWVEEGELPFKVLSGRPGYINLLDALNGWALVSQLQKATATAAAASFKHVSPAGAAIGRPLSDTLKKIYFTSDEELSPQACAYARARGADRMSSFGDFIALSGECDLSTARLIKREVSDGIIAPSYSDDALQVLKAKKGGKYCILQIDGAYTPPAVEERTVFGVHFGQHINDAAITEALLGNIVTENKTLSKEDKTNLIISLITLKYTQSNSVCFVADGQAIGIGAGQQSRIHCTRLAGSKADTWLLRQHPKVLGLQFVDGIKRADRDNAIDVYVNGYFDILSDGVWEKTFKEKPQALTAQEKQDFLKSARGVALGSDAFFPFGDNIERAAASGVSCIAQPGGSVRDDDVIKSCNDHNIVMAFTALRLFHH